MKNITLQTYKGYSIDALFHGGCIVSFEGDDVYFDTVMDAKRFIDDMVSFSF